MNKSELLELIYQWKYFWMNQHQNSKEDHDNYLRRAAGVDANMSHDLANRILKSEMCKPIAFIKGPEHCPKCSEVPWTDADIASFRYNVLTTSLNTNDTFDRLKDCAEKKIKERR